MKYTLPQHRAIHSDSSNIVIVAGPGSGKTATVINRIKRLIDTGIAPESIVALTFTNAAAREMEKRLTPKTPANDIVSAVFGQTFSHPYKLGYCGTLHGFALRTLKQQGSSAGYNTSMTIISPESAAQLLETIARRLGSKTKIDDLLKLKAESRERSFRPTVEEVAILTYYKEMKAAGIVDFDQLLMEFHRLITLPGFEFQNAITHLFVDEVQDSAPTDWAIYRAMRATSKFYVGDPDQAIYGFRGGAVDQMMRETDSTTTETITLEENFRSCYEITTAAQSLIKHNQRRIRKTTYTTTKAGGTVSVIPAANEGAECAIIARRILAEETGIDWSEMAVLCRTNAMAYSIRKQLKAAGIPVTEPPPRTTPRDWPMARALVELLANPENDLLAFFYLIQKYRAYGTAPDAVTAADAVRSTAQRTGVSINKITLLLPESINKELLMQILEREQITAESRMFVAEILSDISPNAALHTIALALTEATTKVPVEPRSPGVQVITIHASKGREFDHVWLPGWEQEIIPGKRPEELEEERRLAFVAITRARRTVSISYCEQREMPWGAIVTHTPSQFIAEATESA